jgi:hypothetical protein
MSDEPRAPEDLLKWGRVVATIGAIELSVAAVLYFWHLEPETWLEMLRKGTTSGGLIALVIGLGQLWEGWRARRRRTSLPIAENRDSTTDTI